MNKHPALWIARFTVLSLYKKTIVPVLANEKRMSPLW